MSRAPDLFCYTGNAPGPGPGPGGQQRREAWEDVHVTLVLTHRCNLACTYCYAGEKTARTMPMDVGWKALALALATPAPEPVHVAFFGGEPLMAFDRLAAFTRLVSRWGRRRGRKVVFTVTTNGTLLNDRRLHFLQHHGFYVGVSLDGVPEAHDRYRTFASGRGSADLVWRNLERAAQVLDHLSVNMVLSPDTIQAVPEAAARLRSIYVYRLELSPDLDAPWDEAARATARGVYGDLVRLYLETRATDHPLFIHPFVDEMARDGAPKVRTGESFCALGTDEVAVAPAGSIYPCARLVGDDRRTELRIGDVDQGVSRERADAVRDEAISRVRSCGGDCHCLCVPLMPGDGSRQVEQMQFFERLAEDALREALAALGHGVPVVTGGG